MKLRIVKHNVIQEKTGGWYYFYTVQRKTRLWPFWWTCQEYFSHMYDDRIFDTYEAAEAFISLMCDTHRKRLTVRPREVVAEVECE